ncbi:MULTISPECIES: hypothetical protein [unclassified Natrinema]|uniref:hypothetical protein n=1 Tax=unclassified Natrinema TaxID=2622230 RepID=UPI001E3F29E9|nr:MULTISPECIES: hypothetical protein [unclassified Natrinema]
MSIQTSNLENARIVVEWHLTVKTTDVCEHHDGQRILEIVFLKGIDRMPPGVLRMLSEYDCGIGSVQHQGEYLIAAAQ